MLKRARPQAAYDAAALIAGLLDVPSLRNAG
jgi:hypothetical protein